VHFSVTLLFVHLLLAPFPVMMQSCLNFVYLAFVVLAVAFMGNFSSPHLALLFMHITHRTHAVSQNLLACNEELSPLF